MMAMETMTHGNHEGSKLMLIMVHHQVFEEKNKEKQNVKIHHMVTMIHRSRVLAFTFLETHAEERNGRKYVVGENSKVSCHGKLMNGASWQP